MAGEFQKIVPGLWRFRSALPGRQHPVNSYVLSNAGQSILIDPSADLTCPAVAQVSEGRVAAVLITHLHAENVQGAAHFQQAPVHVPGGDEYLAQGTEAYERRIKPWPPPWDWESRGNFSGHVAGAKNERPAAEPIVLAQSLHPGRPLAGFDVFSTPGHGKSAVTLIRQIADKRVGFCGDLVCGDGQMWNWFDCEWDYGKQQGQRTLLESVERLRREPIDLLCPTHGPIIAAPAQALAKLATRLAAVLETTPPHDPAPINFAENDSPAKGFRALSPSLVQWRTGNCAVLRSRTGKALMVDDGLCHWAPLAQRRAHHQQVIESLKRALDISRIEIVIPTHYHGDHIENIAELIALENTEVLGLASVAGPIERPEAFNLACLLPWYGTAYDRVKIDRPLPDGAKVQWHEYELELFHLGGQTHYHLGVETTIDGKRTIFCGDAVSGLDASCDAVLCYNDAEPSRRGWAVALDRLIARQPQLLVCGHGIAIADPMPVLKAKRAAWETRLEQFDQLNARETRRLFFDPFV